MVAFKELQYVESKEQKPIELVNGTRILGRKRIVVVLNRTETVSNLSSPFSTPSPKRRSRRIRLQGLNRLESLPQDLLVRILCKVAHADLKQLLLVSKYVNEATLIAKELHFTYSTPRTKHVFRKDDDLGHDDDLEDSRGVPNAPLRHKVVRSRVNFKLDSIAVDLFSSYDD